MPLKEGGGKKLQNYDSKTGKYAKQDISFYYQRYKEIQSNIKKSLPRKERARIKEERRQKEVEDIAKKSKDPLLYHTYKIIVDHFGKGCIIHVNKMISDKVLDKSRELDIITKHCVIEVKSTTAKQSSTQFREQKKFATSRNKKHIVYAPNIPYAAKREYTKQGCVITTTKEELINEMKEVEK